ncbi:unnamed protein product [Lactuca virosa]|uniref:Uncharacterized protein n=1 Tax=Lactuca virosa TaxID=75947 RepID=A0AAU9PSQ4_9ASTR|nr:unnamed protein product [Lactuca virosa]
MLPQSASIRTHLTTQQPSCRLLVADFHPPPLSPLGATQGLISGLTNISAVTQVIHDQEKACKEDEVKQAHSSLDSHEDRQHHQV